MSDVQPRAAGVGKHVEHVVFRPGRVEARLAGVGRVEGLALLPPRCQRGSIWSKGYGLRRSVLMKEESGTQERRKETEIILR